MKIKHDIKTFRLPGMVRDFARKRSSLVAWTLRLGAILLTVVLFFSVFRYGVYLKEAGHTTYFNHALQKIAKLDFSFASTYAKGSLAELDELAIDIKFKHLLRLQYLREQSLKGGLILPEYKSEEFPAKLTHNGKTVNIKIALTGMVAKSHLRNPSKWSFEVKVKGSDTFMGMKRFAMLLPSTRGYLTDWLGFELMKEKDLTGLRVDFVNVSINGKSTGIYYMEERFDKYLIENNRLREGIIFKINGDLGISRESRLMANSSTREQVLLIRRMWQQVMEGSLPPGKLFDLRKMAQAYVVCDLMNNKHPLAGQNLRYYFNPVTGLAEPIAREWEELHGNDQEALSLFIEKPRPATRHFRFERLPFIRMIYDNLEFKKYYIQEAAEACQPQFLDQLLARNEKKLNSMLKKVYRTWPYYEDPKQFLYQNQAYMRSVLFPGTDQLTAFFNKKEDGLLNVYLQNQQYMPLQVNYLTWQDSVRFYPEKPVALDSKVKVPKGEILAFNFKIPENIQWNDAMAGELKAHYNLLGLEPAEKSVPLLGWTGGTSLANKEYNASKEANYSSFSFIEEDKDTITLAAGSWQLSRELVIPANKHFQIAAGAKIDLTNNARIISYSPVFCEGSEEQAILIHSSDDTGRGLMVMEATGHSLISHTTFDNLTGTDKQEGLAAGAITFYKSPVAINSCIFSNNKKGESMLHIIRSELAIDQSLFNNITGNAVDVDFGTGAISNSSFSKIGKNGISIQGTGLISNYVYMNDIGGEAIRVSEESELDARWIELNNTVTAIVSADGSHINLADAVISNSEKGIAAFEETVGAGAASIDIQRLRVAKDSSPFLVEEHSRITLEGRTLPSNSERVVDILYAKPEENKSEQTNEL